MAGTTEAEVPLGDAGLPGILTLPPHARGVVVFAHGRTGPSRSSPGTAFIAKALTEDRFGTLLVDREKGRPVKKLELHSSDGRLLGFGETTLKPRPAKGPRRASA